MAVIDSGTIITGPTEPNWAPDGDYSGFLNGSAMRHFEILCTDPIDGNPFDGTGDTKVEVFADGGLTPVFTYTKVGGYADNYIQLQGWTVSTFDNLKIEKNVGVSSTRVQPFSPITPFPGGRRRVTRTTPWAATMAPCKTVPRLRRAKWGRLLPLTVRTIM